MQTLQVVVLRQHTLLRILGTGVALFPSPNNIVTVSNRFDSAQETLYDVDSMRRTFMNSVKKALHRLGPLL